MTRFSPQITISYGSLEHFFTSTQATTMCTAAQQLAAQGMTIVVSSGDSGVGGLEGQTCPKFVPSVSIVLSLYGKL